MRNGVRWLCWAGVIALVGLTGCAKRVWVMVPPEVELRGYERIGLVDFTGNDPGLNALATRQFQEAVLAAQPGVRVVEIGADGAFHGGADEGFHNLAAKHGVDAVFLGGFEISKVTPRIDLSTSLINLAGSAEQQATLNTRLVEADGGATVWSRSAGGVIEIGRLHANSRGSGHLSVGDPTASQTHLVRDLAGIVTSDFRPTYFRTHPEKVPPHYVLIYVDGDPVYAPPAPGRLSQVERACARQGKLARVR